MYIHEEPRLSYTYNKPLEIGAVVTVEPGIYLQGNTESESRTWFIFPKTER